MVAADAQEAARLHSANLPHGLFPKLGIGFMRRYYGTFLESPHAVALAIGEPGSPAGVLVGVVTPRTHHEWVVRHHGARLAIAGLAALLLRPRLLGEFVRRRLPRYARALRSVLRKQTRGGETESTSSDQPAGVLSHIVVSPASRRSGAGVCLVDAFLAEARRAGLERVRATTLDGPDGAARFYERTGWQRRSGSTNWDGQSIVLFERATDVNVRTE